MRVLMTTMLLLAGAGWGQSEKFQGWSKDGSWLVYEQHGADDRVELYFCGSDSSVEPTWPATLKGMDREDVNGLSCVRFLDPNKAPYQWKNLLVLPAPATEQQGVSISHELATDGETPGFVLAAGDKKQACYASGTREGSKLQKSWFHPSGRFVAAQIDGNFRHCVSTLKPVKVKGGGKKK